MKYYKKLLSLAIFIIILNTLTTNFIRIKALSDPVKLSSSTSLTLSSNPINSGQPVTFTAKVSGLGNIPTGSTSLYDGGNFINNSGLDSSGTVNFTIYNLSIGNHNISVLYNGDETYSSSTSNTSTLIVNNSPNSSNITLSADINPSTSSKPVTFLAKVTGSSGVATGNVTFNDGSTNLGTSILDNNGQANFLVSNLSFGQHSITAIYNGDSKYSSSNSNVVLQTVNNALITSTIILTSNNTSARPGDSISLSATVTGGSITPTGKMSFSDGSNVLSTLNIDNAAQATYSVNTLTVGQHNITATYNGDSIYTSSSSNILTLTISSALLNSLTVLTSNNNTISSGQIITLNVKITGDNNQSSTSVSSSSSIASSSIASLIPTGVVVFKDANLTLGTQTLDTNGQATLSIKSLNKGVNNITAEYAGDSNFKGSQSNIINIVVSDNSSSGVSSGLIAFIVGILVSALTALGIFGRRWYLKRKQKQTLVNNIDEDVDNDPLEDDTVPQNSLVETHVPEDKNEVFKQLDDEIEGE